MSRICFYQFPFYSHVLNNLFLFCSHHSSHSDCGCGSFRLEKWGALGLFGLQRHDPIRPQSP